MRRILRWVALLPFIALLAWWGLAPLSFSTWHSKVEDSPARHGVAFEDVTFTAADEPIPLRAWWMPARQPKAALIMVHGGGSNRAQPYTDWLDLARALIAHGYAVMALDLRNHGDSGDSARGKPTFGPDEANDVVAAMDEITLRQPGTRFGGIGHSMGGQVLLYTAARDPRLEAVVSDCTFTDIAAIVPQFAHAASGLPAVLFAGPFLWSTRWLHGVPLDEAHAIDVIGTVRQPILIVHDGADPIVPVEHAYRLAKAAPQASLWITGLPPDQPLPRAARSRFGTHVKSYAFNRVAYEERVEHFFDDVFAPREPCRAEVE